MARQKTSWKATFNVNGYLYVKRYADLAETLKVLKEKDLPLTDTLTEMNEIANMFMENLVTTFKVTGEPVQSIIELETNDKKFGRDE